MLQSLTRFYMSASLSVLALHRWKFVVCEAIQCNREGHRSHIAIHPSACPSSIFISVSNTHVVVSDRPLIIHIHIHNHFRFTSLKILIS